MHTSRREIGKWEIRDQKISFGKSGKIANTYQPTLYFQMMFPDKLYVFQYRVKEEVKVDWHHQILRLISLQQCAVSENSNLKSLVLMLEVVASIPV